VDIDDVADRLAAIAEELGDLAFDRLREATSGARRTGTPDPAVVAEEKRLTRARRAVEKAVVLLRRHAPALARPYKMWLYPLPAALALAGWIFVFVTKDRKPLVVGLGTLAAGALLFVLWSWSTRKWPFGTSALPELPSA